MEQKQIAIWQFAFFSASMNHGTRVNEKFRNMSLASGFIV